MTSPAGKDRGGDRADSLRLADSVDLEGVAALNQADTCALAAD
jgi:hypothetical protein